MNIENINDLIEQLGKVKHRVNFSMLTYASDCGAPSCIAGWAAHMAGCKYITALNAQDVGAEYIGIDLGWSMQMLFEPPFNTYTDITPAEAQYALAKIAANPKSYQDLTIEDLWPKKVEREHEPNED